VRCFVEKLLRIRQAACVKLTNLLALLPGAVLLAGCKKTETVAAPPSDDDSIWRNFIQIWRLRCLSSKSLDGDLKKIAASGQIIL
jgi:hypothetical protein